MNIAFLAHDKKKELMVQFCIAYKSVLAKHTLYATAATGRLIADNTGLPVTQLLSRKEFRNANGPHLIYASLPDKDFVAKAREVGVGGKIDMVAGAEVDDRYAPPVRLKGTVTAIYDHPSNSEVAVRVGSIDVIVTEVRKGFHTEKEFTKLGLNPRTADIVMVKIGYLEPELYNMQADWMMALTLGGVNQDLPGLPYRRINRPMYPLDKDMPDPDLSARDVPFVK